MRYRVVDGAVSHVSSRCVCSRNRPGHHPFVGKPDYGGLAAATGIDVARPRDAALQSAKAISGGYLVIVRSREIADILIDHALGGGEVLRIGENHDGEIGVDGQTRRG